MDQIGSELVKCLQKDIPGLYEFLFRAQFLSIMFNEQPVEAVAVGGASDCSHVFPVSPCSIRGPG